MANEESRAIYRLDDSEDPGEATVRVMNRVNGKTAQAVKGLTGYDIYKVEILEVHKPSTLIRNPKAGSKRQVSAKHLTMLGKE